MSTLIFNLFHLEVCVAGQFKCRTGGECVAKTAVCDGEKDCTDWSDEDNCKKLQGIKLYMVRSLPSSHKVLGSISAFHPYEVGK